MKKLKTPFRIIYIFIASMLFLSTSLAMAQQNVTAVSVSPDSVTISVGDSVQLTGTIEPTNATNKNVSWESSNESVAMVSQAGVVTGVSEGAVIISVITNDGGYTATSAITVNIPPNIPPSISITTPSDSASFSEPANITIITDVKDEDGTVKKVAFYNGTTKIGEDSISVYGTGTLPKHWHETNGFGTDTKGGIAGQVYKVTNLNSSGAGSLSDAVSESNRLVVFEVGGVIEDGFIVDGSNITIAGQTAPYPGITTIKGNITIMGSNIVVSHINHHLGSEVDFYPDAFNVINSSNIVLDHVAVYWGKDETLPIHYSNNVTLYKCIIAEGLQFTGHEDGEHSKGLWLVDDSKLSVIGSLSANNALRNPRLDEGEAFLANFVVYNWGTGWDHQGPKISNDNQIETYTECFEKVISARFANVNLVGSVALGGPESEAEYFLDGHNGSAIGYLEGNIIKDREGNDLKMANTEGEFTGGASGQYGAITLLDSPTIWPDGMVPLPADEALYEVLRTAGPQPGNRTAHNARIVKDLADGTGEIIDSEDEVGGYPDYPESYRPISVPDGAEARQAWLDSLEDEIAIDTTIDLSRLYSMVGSQFSDIYRLDSGFTFSWKGVKEGTYTLTAVATDNNGDKSTSSPVTLVVSYADVTGVTVSPNSVSVDVGATIWLISTVEPSNASNKNVIWNSSNTSVATVNASGRVTGVAEGSATIKVTTEDGSFSATSSITVNFVSIPVYSLAVRPFFVSISEGATVQLTATVEPSDATYKNINWSSNDILVATVSSSGLVTGVTVGTAHITATTQDGSKTAICNIIVTKNSTNSAIDNYYSSNVANKSLVVYPNPVTGKLKVTIGNEFTEDASIQVFDNTGRMVVNMKSTGKEISIDMGSYPSGLYLIKVSDDRKFIVQHIVKK